MSLLYSFLTTVFLMLPMQDGKKLMIMDMNSNYVLIDSKVMKIGDVFMEVVHAYPDITVHLTLFNAAISEGIPQKLEHNDIQWITPSEIPNYAFCPADEEILNKIRKDELNV